MSYTPYQKYDWQVGDEISESKLDHIEGGLEDASNQIPLKADAVGSHPDLGSGYTTTLKPTKYNKDEQPYLFRKALGARLTSEKIVGGTVAWNQLVQDGNFTQDWFYNNGTGSVANNVLTFTASAKNGVVRPNNNKLVSMINNHVYFGAIKIKTTTTTEEVAFSLGTGSARYTLQTTEWQTLSTLYKSNETGEVYYPRITDARESNWDAIQLKNCITVDLTLAFGTTIADHIYALEQATAGAGVAFLRNNGFMTKDYYAYDAGGLQSVLTSGHRTVGKNQANLAVYKQGYVLGSDGAESANSTYCITESFPVLGGSDYSGSFVRVKGDDVLRIGFYDGNMNFISRPTFTDNHRLETAPANARYARLSYRNVEPDMANIQVEIGSEVTAYEPYSAHLYPLSPVSLRGIMTLVDGKLQNDGDEYLPDGTVKRNWAERDYQEGDASDGSTMITNGIKTVYKLTTPTTETADPYQSEQTCSEYGTESFIDTRDVPIPVGHVTKYWPDLTAKIEALPDVTAIAPVEDGTTASKAYTVGQYFFRGGEFCKAKTNIASGATFTLNTNYETTTIAAELYAALNS